MNNATAYRTISAHSSGNFYNVDKIPDNGNRLISLIKLNKERTMRYKVMHIIIVVFTR